MVRKGGVICKDSQPTQPSRPVSRRASITTISLLTLALSSVSISLQGVGGGGSIGKKAAKISLLLLGLALLGGEAQAVGGSGGCSNQLRITQLKK